MATPAHPDDPPHWRHETAHVNGIEMHYVTVPPAASAVDHPTGNAPLVVLLHGFPEHWYAWRHQLDPLAQAGYRVVAPDLRGYNRSSQPPGVDSYRPDTLVADIRGLIEHRGPPEATVVGHDWGGLLGWELAIRDPTIVSRLAVLNAPHPAAYRQALRRSPTQLLRSWYVFAAQLPWVPDRLLWAGRDQLVNSIADGTVEPGAFSDATLDRYREAIERAGGLTGPLNYYRAMARDTIRQELDAAIPGQSRREERVDCPTLVCWGERDPVLDGALLDGLDEWVPNSRIVRLPDVSHWVQAEAPERVNTELIRFLR